MPAYPKNYPFYNWVPKPIGIIILFMFFLPILTVGGTYSASGTEMMSGLGIISEHIQFANFATSIGMAAFCPFLYRLVCIRREKMMCIVGFSLMYIFSYICAKTDSIFLLALCSLFMGFLRMVLMMVNLFTLIKYAGNVEATEKITPAMNPPPVKVGTNWILNEALHNLPFTCFHGIGTVGHIAYSMAYLRIRVAICLLLHDGVAVALYPHYLRHDALS